MEWGGKMKKVMLVLLISLFAVSLIWGFVASPAAEAAPDKVLFMYANCLSGNYAWLGQRELWGTEMAVEHINKMGGIKSLGGAEVEIWKVVDLTSDSKMGAAALEAALASAQSKGVPISAICTATVSGMMGPIIPVAEKYGVPFFGSVGKSGLTDMGAKYFFRIFPRNEYWAKAQADFVKLVKEKHMPGFKKLAFAYEETAWPTDLTMQAKKWLEKYQVPVDIVAEVGYPKGMVDATPIIAKLRASGAEVVVLTGYAETLYILRAADAIKYKPLWLGGGGFFVQPEFLEERGPEGVKGICCAMSCNHAWDNPIAKGVSAEFSKRHPKFPFITEHGISGYSGAWIAKYGVEAAKSTDPVKVKDALHNLEIVMGPAEDEGKMKDGAYVSPRALYVCSGSGRLKFNEKGDNIYMSGCLVQWQDINNQMQPVMVSPEKLTPYRLIKP